MASKVAIANMALGFMGEPPITALTDDNTAARTMNLFFDSVRDELLRSHPWNFAKKRRNDMSELGDSPTFGFDHAYALPSDFLRLLSFNTESDDNYRLELVVDSAGNETRCLATDADEADIVYVARITDTAIYDPMFTQALAAALAAATAMQITNSGTVTTKMDQLAAAKLALARSIDAQEEPPQIIEADDFINARRGGGKFRPIEPADS